MVGHLVQNQARNYVGVAQKQEDDHMAITLERAVQGFNLHLGAENRSPRTIAEYNVTLSRLVDYLGATTPLETITTNDVRRSSPCTSPDPAAPGL